MKTTVSLVISTLLASTTAADTLWRQYGFNAAHTSYNDSETILSPSNVSHLTLLWTSDTFNAQTTAPTLGPTSVFVASDGRVRALKENRSEEHTSELQSHSDLVCRLLLEKTKHS